MDPVDCFLKEMLILREVAAVLPLSRRRYLQHDVIGCAHQVEQLESQLASRMEQLQATVQSKTAVPTAQVYVRTFTTHSVHGF